MTTTNCDGATWPQASKVPATFAKETSVYSFEAGKVQPPPPCSSPPFGRAATPSTLLSYLRTQQLDSTWPDSTIDVLQQALTSLRLAHRVGQAHLAARALAEEHTAAGEHARAQAYLLELLPTFRRWGAVADTCCGISIWAIGLG